jgi:hypothetical protein
MKIAYWYGGGAPWPIGKRLVTLLRELRAHGVDGYMPQYALEEAATYIDRFNVRKACSDEGVSLFLGLGLDRGRSTRSDEAHEKNVTRAILSAAELAAAGTVARVSLNWETYWTGKRAMAERIATAVLKRGPTAGTFEDCPWWAPLFYVDSNGRKRPTHPRAPTVEFGRLVGSRFVQAYGAQADGSPDGRSLAMLKWSRSPTQYKSLGVWPVYATTQLYGRSLNDHVHTLLAEPAQRLWTWNEADRRAKLALRAVQALAERGFTGPDAVIEFQVAEKIAADDVVGPVTLWRLELGPKP